MTPELRRDLTVTGYYRWEMGGDEHHAPWVIEVHPLDNGHSRLRVYSAGGLPADEQARPFAEGLARHLASTFFDSANSEATP